MTLHQRAQQLDQANGLTDEQQRKNQERLRDYRRRLAKLHAVMIRTDEKMPTEEDFMALRRAEAAYSGASY